MDQFAMKMYKFEVHVLDFNNHSPETYKEMLENVKHIIGKTFHVGTAEIGEWDDEIDLNNNTATIETYNNYYKKD